jgi:hypothetical protein
MKLMKYKNFVDCKIVSDYFENYKTINTHTS